MKEYLAALHRDSLFRNSFYLMMATAMMAGFGFLFWIIAARIFTVEEIGVATTLISVMNLVIYLSLAGFNVAFVRFLPTAREPNKNITAGLMIVGAVALVASAGFVLLVRVLSPTLAFIESNHVAAALFIIACTAAALNVLTESVFLAYRRTGFTLVSNTAASIVKLSLPFAFSGFGALGIFGAAAGAQLFGLLFNLTVFVRTFAFRPAISRAGSVLREVWAYTAGNYVASIFNLLPVAILPLIIVDRIGTEPAAYYYLVMMIANMLYVIPTATTRSLLAEGATDEKSISANIHKSLGFIAALLGPAILVLLAGGHLLLRVFGPQYADGGAGFLRIMALTGVLVAVSALLGTLFQIRKNVRGIILMNACYAAVSLGLGYAFVDRGLVAVGLSVAAGALASNIVGLLLYSKFAHFLTIVDEFCFFQWLRLTSKLAYVRARMRNPGQPFTVLCYPDRPRPMHQLYLLSHHLGIRLSQDPDKAFDRVIAFEDVEQRSTSKTLDALTRRHGVINAGCADITKSRVEEIFADTFGYDLRVDPRTATEPFVRKSEANALHDGVILTEPREPEPGYVYQKLVDNRFDDETVYDLRVLVFGDSIPGVFFRYRSVEDRFDNTQSVRFASADEAFTKEEQRDILRFCTAFGADRADLDVVRDRNDGRIYIVDVNTAPSIPRAGVHLSKAEYRRFFDTVLAAFSEMISRPVATTGDDPVSAAAAS